MGRSIIGSVRRFRRGFTLIELLVVMAIVGVLAGIVTVSVSGTGDTSNVAQVRSDAGTVESAASSFFTDQTEAGSFPLAAKSVDVTAAIASSIVLTTGGSLALGTVTYDTGVNEAAVIQERSGRWPEVFITENSDTVAAITLACVASAYCNEFPTTGLNSNGVVIKVIVADSEGAAIVRSTLLGTYTAVDFVPLLGQGYVVATPDGAIQTADVIVSATKTIKVHNFLWLFRKSTSAGGGAENDSRSVAVFKLANVKVTDVPNADDTVTLSYAQVF